MQFELNRITSASLLLAGAALFIWLFSAAALSQQKNTSPAKQVEPNRGSLASLELNEKGIAAINQKRFADAEEYFRKALAIDQGNVTAAFNLAGMLMNNGKAADAVRLLTSYTKSYAEDPALFSRLGDAYFASKNVEKAAEAYEAAFRVQSEYAGLAARLGTVYLLLNRPGDAEKVLMEAVQHNPRDRRSLANLAGLLLANGQPDKAIGLAKKALQIRPTADVYITLGTAYELSEDFKNALIAFQRARDMGDDREELKKKIEGFHAALK